MPQYKLIYFNGRGRAEPTRLLFAAAGVAYEDIRISQEDWPKLKSATPYGTLPILEVDGKIVPQSAALTRYLARQFGFTGKNEFESATCDSLADGVQDVVSKMGPWFKETDPVKKDILWKEYEEKDLKPFVDRYEKFLDENGTGYFVGNQLTWADLWIYHMVESHCLSLLNNHQRLSKFANQIRNLPNIKPWLETRPKTPW